MNVAAAASGPVHKLVCLAANVELQKALREDRIFQGMDFLLIATLLSEFLSSSQLLRNAVLG